MTDSENNFPWFSIEQAAATEEEFFAVVREQLNAFCANIATQCNAQSASVFFATEDPRAATPFMVMRGASGRLEETFKYFSEQWSPTGPNPSTAAVESFATGSQPATRDLQNLPGFAYRSLLSPQVENASAEEQMREVACWPVTNQIWHLASGRIANSNRAMDELKCGPGGAPTGIRQGMGDEHAYPGKKLETTFRNMVGVPIFAEGGQSHGLLVDEFGEGNSEYPASASANKEFLSKYRVTGILKVEGKLPPREHRLENDSLSRRIMELREFRELPADAQSEVENWCRSVQTLPAAADAFGPNGPDLPACMKGTKPQALAFRNRLVDELGNLCRALFTRQDTELLVLSAMQIGRLLTSRVIKYAAKRGIAIGENEIGLLNIRWHDISDLALVFKATDTAHAKLEAFLKQLMDTLDFATHQEVYRARVSELLDARGPIRQFTCRRKQPLSLIQKLVRKQRELERDTDVHEVYVSSLKGRLEGYGHLAGENYIGRGPARIFVGHPQVGMASIDITAELGRRGVPHLMVRAKGIPAAIRREPRQLDIESPLIRRILDPDYYAVDDLCGARIITDYDSDIDVILDELRTQSPLWGFELLKVEDRRQDDREGYRASHVTLALSLDGYIPREAFTSLREALGRLPIRLPIEIQLRTAYQDSWAKKTHSHTYKREAWIPDELKDESEILSNVLRQADWLSDIVKSGVQQALFPDDYGERKLLEYLRPRLPREDLSIVRFGIDSTKEALKERLRYNGKPAFSFAIEVCQQLVYSFEVLDPNMLLLSLLRNIWRQCTVAIIASDCHTADRSDSIVARFCAEMRRQCPLVLERYRDRLPLSASDRRRADWFERWMGGGLPQWFWAVQASHRLYFQLPRENRELHWEQRLRDVFTRILQGREEGGKDRLEDSLERAYIVESAVLLASLGELPSEPGRKRRVRLRRQYQTLAHQIRNYLPNGPMKWRVMEELGRSLRSSEYR